MSEIDRRFCWRCLFLALVPFALLAVISWFAITRAEAGRATVALEVDALMEELSDLENSNAALRAQLGGAQEAARAARAAAMAGGSDVDGLMAQLQALPEADRVALLSAASIDDDPDAIAARVEKLNDEARGRFYHTLSSLRSFSDWFGALDSPARRNWLRQLPGGDVLGDATVSLPGLGQLDAAAVSERMALLRDQAEEALEERDALREAQEAAVKERDALAAERDRLAEQLDDAIAPRAAQVIERLASLEPAEQSMFFGALPRSDLFAGWFSRATVEEQEAFVAAAPTSFRRALDGMEIPREGWLSAAEIRRRLADGSIAPDANSAPASEELERLRSDLAAKQELVAALDAELVEARRAASVSAPGRGPMTSEEAGALIASLDRDVENAAEQADRAAARRLDALRQERDAAREEIAGLRETLSQRGADRNAASEATIGALQAELDEARAELLQKQSAIDTLSAAARRTAQDAALNTSIVNRIKDRIADPAEASAPADVGARTALQLSSSVAFETASATLSDAGRAALDDIAAELKAELAVRPDRGWRLMIKGHTDSRPINTEQFPSNWTLSAARAAAVARYLSARGVPPERLFAIGRAEFEPVNAEETAVAYAQNRRIEFEIVGE